MLSPSGQLNVSLEEEQSSDQRQHDPYSPAAAKMCTNCGKSHSKKDTCLARGQQCNYCLKLDHFATECRSKLRDSKRNVVRNSASNGSDLDLSPCESLFIDSIDFNYLKTKLLLKCI